MILDLLLARACLADQSWPPMVDLAVGLRVTEQNGAEEAGAGSLGGRGTIQDLLLHH